ncbi:MAG: ABC transporter ATP-binding protein, partial [Pseudomonadota bacterium]
RAKARARISELLEEYNLTEQAGQRAGSMSGGQKQRLSLAAAVLHRPKLLFLDEPTSAVDPETRRAFWEKLFDLVDQGASIVVSTHFMDEAERCHRIAILDKGTKRADGEPFQLMKDLGLAVIEIAGDQLRDVKKTLAAAPEVVSAAQVGARLRVLVKDTTPDPVDTVRRLSGLGSAGEVHKTRPNLEDVFVNATRGAP